MRAAFVLRLAAAVCAVVCVGVLAACAAEPASTPSTPTGQEPSDRSPATSADAATEVRVEVSGGITGAHRVYQLTQGVPPRDLSPRAARAVLRLADTEAVRGMDDVRLEGAVPCCDRQVVDVTVTYADGARTRVRTVEMASVPPQLRRMVALLTGAR
ncbi:MAG: hypothetical protein ACRDO0_18010 [Nocardioidaceae bacterium]